MKNNSKCEFELINDSDITIPLQKTDFEKIILCVSETENIRYGMIEAVYVRPEVIIRLNIEYLNRDYVTDIITFPYSEKNSNESDGVLDATMIMCAKRIVEQSLDHKTTEIDEYKRIFIHGLLHLLCPFPIL